MKLNDAQRFELFRIAFTKLMDQPVRDWPTTTPANKAGEKKPASVSFAIACHASKFARDAEYVLDDSDANGEGATSQGGAPF